MFCHLLSLYSEILNLYLFGLQYQMYSLYTNILVAVSQTSAYDVVQQRPHQILMDAFQNSKLHLSTRTI